jgi:urease accessory protein
MSVGRLERVEAPAGWKAQLSLHYTHHDGRTGAHDRHEGPLRVLQRLYPEGPGICHHVLVHPPGGIVGGDTLDIHVNLGPGAHALLTTPGATRFYRSEGRPARQQAHLAVADGARLEWLPLETIAWPGCLAHNGVQFQLAPGGQMMGWDLLALGLPAAGTAFDRGHITTALHWPGQWLDRGRIDGADTTLLQSPLGLGGHTVTATLWLASGSPWPRALREALLDEARALGAASACAAQCGATAVQPGLLLLRVLAHRVEPAWHLLQAVRGAWRRQAWGLDAAPPRIWRT